MKTGLRSSLAFCVILLLASCVPLSEPLPAPAPVPADPTAAPAQTAPDTTGPTAEAATDATPVRAEPTAAPTTSTAGLTNPASVHCTDNGGALTIEKRGDGGEFGVCTFAEGWQCEEWALLRGHCLVGGHNVTGFVTPAARYCAITGGAYAPTGNTGQEDEQGICILPNGVECDVWDYYNGQCTA